MKLLLAIFCCIFFHGASASTNPAAVSDTSDNNSWIYNAIIYEITPYLFTENTKYPDIEVRLPELTSLGINTIWLQPVFKTHGGGQGYDIIDYFSLRPDLGTEEELSSLITTAHSLGLKVIFDFVANHTSIHHPYAKDVIENRESSIYYDYYQTQNDGADYSSHYNRHPAGFIYYFWNDLVNLNFNNPNVRQWMIDACKYWIEHFDIDGYRFDAAWGFSARNPAFSQQLTQELKSLKPSVLLLAEDKGSRSTPYDNGFDAAFDWASGTSWVSQWSWEYEYTEDQSKTVFNHPSVNQRAQLLRKALFDDYQSGLRLRYLENNDMHRFIANHSQAVTEMAATLIFSLPGIPLIYNGQEIGFRTFPYISGPIFEKNRTIASKNSTVFNMYSRLTNMRKTHPSLTNTYIKEIKTPSNQGIVAFHRKDDEEDILVIMNMGNTESNVTMDVSEILTVQGSGISLTDVLSGDTLIAYSNAPGNIQLKIRSSTAKVFSVNRDIRVEPESSEVARVGPNPSNGRINIFYTMQQAGNIDILIFDRWGRNISSFKKSLNAGTSTLAIDLSGFNSGMYYLQTIEGNKKKTHKIVIGR